MIVRFLLQYSWCFSVNCMAGSSCRSILDDRGSPERERRAMLVLFRRPRPGRVELRAEYSQLFRAATARAGARGLLQRAAPPRCRQRRRRRRS